MEAIIGLRAPKVLVELPRRLIIVIHNKPQNIRLEDPADTLAVRNITRAVYDPLQFKAINKLDIFFTSVAEKINFKPAAHFRIVSKDIGKSL